VSGRVKDIDGMRL